MTLPTGTISMSQVNTELGIAATTTISLNQSNVRTLAGVPSGTISMNNLRGKSNQFAFSFSGGANVDLRSLAVAYGWNGSSKVVATNNGTIYSNSTGSAALTISGSFPGGVTFVNNALIVGRGGNGGTGGSGSPAGTATAGNPGSSGGLALSVSTPVSITNNSTIAGGGGGGGGGGGRAAMSSSAGGGGGGGIGGSSGGGVQASGQPGATAGGSGTYTSAGGGGSGALYAGAGGAGGGYGAAGVTGQTATASVARAGGAGGAAGACTSGNGNITWVATGNRYGALN